MNILITGATGLIGSYLIKELFSTYESLTITAVSRFTNSALVSLGCQVITIDDLTVELISKQNVIINLAGEPIAEKRWSQEQKNKIETSRLVITERLSSLIQQTEKPPQVFISGSAIGFYGRQDKSTVIDESFTDVYLEFSHVLCKKWEAEALKAESAFTRVCLLRTGIVLDKKQGALAKMLPSFKFGGGAVMASGEQIMSWIHITDMVNAIIHLIENEAINGVVNMTAPNAVSNRVFSKALAKSLKRPCLLVLPKPVLTLMFGEMADLLIYGQNVKPNKLLNSGFNFSYPEINQALKSTLR